jgi:hypothetical protein
MRTFMSSEKGAFEIHQDMTFHAYPFPGTADARRRL